MFLLGKGLVHLLLHGIRILLRGDLVGKELEHEPRVGVCLGSSEEGVPPQAEARGILDEIFPLSV